MGVATLEPMGGGQPGHHEVPRGLPGPGGEERGAHRERGERHRDRDPGEAERYGDDLEST